MIQGEMACHPQMNGDDMIAEFQAQPLASTEQARQFSSGYIGNMSVYPQLVRTDIHRSQRLAYQRSQTSTNYLHLGDLRHGLSIAAATISRHTSCLVTKAGRDRHLEAIISGMKIWHEPGSLHSSVDDIRRPPADGWVWARTNEEAQKLLEMSQVTEISLDHDLGLDHLDPLITPDADYLQGTGANTGADLIRWMIARKLLPETIEIHSWSADGRETMTGLLLAVGVVPLIKPFDPACRALDR